jgi:hypothetical protein
MRDRTEDIRQEVQKHPSFDFISLRLEDAFDIEWWNRVKRMPQGERYQTDNTLEGENTSQTMRRSSFITARSTFESQHERLHYAGSCAAAILILITDTYGHTASHPKPHTRSASIHGPINWVIACDAGNVPHITVYIFNIINIARRRLQRS